MGPVEKSFECFGLAISAIENYQHSHKRALYRPRQKRRNWFLLTYAIKDRKKTKKIEIHKQKENKLNTDTIAKCDEGGYQILIVCLCIYKELELIIRKFVWGLIFRFKFFLDKT